jgi:hypothetical protein
MSKLLPVIAVLFTQKYFLKEIDNIQGSTYLSFENNCFWKEFIIEYHEWDSDAKIADYKIEFDL